MSPTERALREQAEAMGLPVFPSEPAETSGLTDKQIRRLWRLLNDKDDQ
jgi:hypothetical protein